MEIIDSYHEFEVLIDCLSNGPPFHSAVQCRPLQEGVPRRSRQKVLGTQVRLRPHRTGLCGEEGDDQQEWSCLLFCKLLEKQQNGSGQSWYVGIRFIAISSAD